MRSYSINLGFILIVVALFLTGTAQGQDLGSSNKLFGGGKQSAPSTKTKTKKGSKAKPVASKKKAPAAKSTTAKAAKPEPKKPAAKKTTTAESKQPKTAPKQVAIDPKKTRTMPKETAPESKRSPARIVAESKKAKAAKQTASETKQAPGRFSKFDAAKKKPIEVKKVEIASVSKPAEREVPISAAERRQYEQLIEEGNRARDERRYGSAESAYKRAISIQPKEPRAVYGLGNLYSDQQRWDEAEDAYRKALDIAPKDVPTRIALSYVLTQPLAADNLSDRYAKAEQLASTAIKLDSKNAMAFDQLGASLELRGLIGAETENAYRRAIQLDPTFAPAYAHLGRLLRRRGMARESAAAYLTAVDRASDAPSKVLIAEVLQSEQRFGESEKLLRSAIDEDPKNPAALLLLGRALTTLKDYDEAERTLRRSLDLSPNGFLPNSLLASLYLRQDKLGQAENALLQALRWVSESQRRSLARLFETLGDSYFRSGKRADAARSYRQAARLDEENSALAEKIARVVAD